jgi:hypothetical protein
MNKEFIPYELALELKQLGFDEPCLAYYKDGKITGVNKWDREDWGFHVITNKEVTSVTSEIVIAPTYSQAFRWFREKHNCHHTINLNKKYVGIAYSSVVNFSIDEFNTYEEAELACLVKLIELVKTREK